MKVIKCPECGNKIVLDVIQSHIECKYCNSNIVITPTDTDTDTDAKETENLDKNKHKDLSITISGDLIESVKSKILGEDKRDDAHIELGEEIPAFYRLGVLLQKGSLLVLKNNLLFIPESFNWGSKKPRIIPYNIIRGIDLVESADIRFAKNLFVQLENNHIIEIYVPDYLSKDILAHINNLRNGKDYQIDLNTDSEDLVAGAVLATEIEDVNPTKLAIILMAPMCVTAVLIKVCEVVEVESDVVTFILLLLVIASLLLPITFICAKYFNNRL